jgi:hypothetical protein
VVVRVVAVVDCQDLLLEVVGRLQPGRRLANLLNGWQQQPDQDSDDSDDDEELHEGEASPEPNRAKPRHRIPLRLEKITAHIFRLLDNVKGG